MFVPMWILIALFVLGLLIGFDELFGLLVLLAVGGGILWLAFWALAIVAGLLTA